MKNLNPQDITYLFFIAGWIGVQMTMYMHRGADSALGELWDFGLSYDLLTNVRRLRFARQSPHCITPEFFQMGLISISIRCMMGVIVNFIFRDIVAFTVPLLLMQFHDPLNCVVYAVGVNFIVTMDASHPVKYTVEVAEEPLSETPPSAWSVGNSFGLRTLCTPPSNGDSSFAPLRQSASALALA